MSRKRISNLSVCPGLAVNVKTGGAISSAWPLFLGVDVGVAANAAGTHNPTVQTVMPSKEVM